MPTTERIIQVRKPDGSWEFGSKVASAREALEHQNYVLRRFPGWAVRAQPICNVDAQMADAGVFRNRRATDEQS